MCAVPNTKTNNGVVIMSEKVNLWKNAAQAYLRDFGFNPNLDGNDAEASINIDLRDQKELAEELVANHPVAKAIVNNATAHTVLSGISVSVDTNDDKLNDELETHIKRWSKTKACDASRRLDLSGIFQTTLRNFYTYGESFGLIVNTSQKYPVSFRGIDWHQFTDPKDGDRIIRNGVELDAYNRAVRIWLKGAKNNVISKPYFDSEGNPIVLHCFRQDYFNTSHGVVPFTSVYTLLLNLSVFIKSEVNAAMNSSQLNIIQKRANPTAMLNQLGTTEITNGNNCPIKAAVLPVRPNMHLMLNPGDQIEQFKLERPSGMFEPFTSYINKIVCAAYGLSYEYLFSSWADSNFSSARINALQNQAVIRANQQLAIDTTIMPLVRALVKSLVESGEVKASMDIDELLDAIKIIYPQMPLLDPQREIAAAAARMEANLSNLQIEAEKLGLGDYMAILQQKARENEEISALRVASGELPAQSPGAPAQEGNTRG